MSCWVPCTTIGVRDQQRTAGTAEVDEYSRGCGGSSNYDHDDSDGGGDDDDEKLPGSICDDGRMVVCCGSCTLCRLMREVRLLSRRGSCNVLMALHHDSVPALLQTPEWRQEWSKTLGELDVYEINQLKFGHIDTLVYIVHRRSKRVKSAFNSKCKAQFESRRQKMQTRLSEDKNRETAYGRRSKRRLGQTRGDWRTKAAI